MLVSSIARFNAINTMYNATSNMMNASSALMNTAANMHTFGGEHDLNMLHNMDKKLSLDLASNSLLYKISYLQEKAAKKRQEQEIKKILDVIS